MARKAEDRERERRDDRGIRAAHRIEADHGFAPRGRKSGADFRDLALDGIEPVGIGALILQQAIAMAQGILKGTRAARMVRVDREHEAIEKTPPIPRRSPEQAVLIRREPEKAEMIEEAVGAGHRLAIDATDPPGLARQHRRAERDIAQPPLALGMDGEGTRARFPRHAGELRTAQSTARTEQRQGLEDIGLARAIGPRQCQQPRGRGEIEAGIAAEIREAQAADERAWLATGHLDPKSGRAHTRMGIST